MASVGINKLQRNYRISAFILEEMEKMCKKERIKYTTFIEMAIIEKIQRIKEGK